jgi:ribosome-associated translation inhibitor RaiA
MKMPMTVNVPGIQGAAQLEQKIRQRAAKLERFSSDIQNCQVWLEAPEGHHRNGRLYRVRVRLTLPGEEIVVEEQPPVEDPHAAIRGSFDAARRQLEDFVRRRRGQVKSHPRASAPETTKKGSV